jgi:midasin
VCVAISSWLECAPSLRYILRPLYTWLSARPSTLIITEPTDDSGEKTSYSEHLLETLLIRMQKLVALTPVPDPSGYQGDELGGDEDADNVMRDRSRQVMQTTLALHLKLVVLHTNALLTSLQSTPASEVKRRLAVVLPFLARFLPLAKNQVEQQAAWARSLLKLTYVLANTVRSVAKEGFCRLPDVEDSGEGEGKTVEGAEGTGLGAGQGAEDVSKEIEDESQVEGLKGEQDEQQDGEKGEGDAVEMSEDFAGEMEDVDKGEEGEGEEDGSEEEDDGPEPEEQLGKLDASDPEAVDEKMWGDEKGPDARDDDQHAGDNAADQPDQDPSELAAKDEGKKGGKKDGKEQEKEQQEPEEDENMDEPEPGEDEAQEEEGEPSGVGVQMDDHVQEADTLDLPDDLHLDQQGDGEESDSSTEGDDMDVDEEMQVEEKSLEDQQKALDEEDQPGTPRPEEHPEPSTEDQEPHADANDTTHEATQDDADDNDGSRNEQDTVANADISAGPTDTTDQQDATTLDHDVGESTSQGQAAGRRQAGGQDAGDQDTSEKQTT